MEMPRDELEELKRRTQASLSLIMGSTIPILNHDEAPEVVASGVLVDVGSEPVLLTAAHVADKYYRGEYLVTIRGKDGKGTIPLGPPMTMRSPVRKDPERHDDPFDIAVVRFPPEVQAELASQFKPLPTARMRNDLGQSEVFYTAYGFPFAMSPRNEFMRSLHVNPMYSVAFLAGPETRVDPPHDPNVQLLLRYEPGEDHEGKPADPPYPKGMSGCGLWRITRRPKRGEYWTSEEVALVGIVHTLNKMPSFLRATQIHYAKLAILQSFKENPVFVSPILPEVPPTA